MMSTEDMLNRVAVLERTLVKPVKRSVGKAATKAAKAAAKKRKAEFKAQAWHRARLSSTLSRYAL